MVSKLFKEVQSSFQKGCSRRSSGWVTQAAILLALPPNQNGYLIALFCRRCSLLSAVLSALAADLAVTSAELMASSRLCDL